MKLSTKTYIATLLFTFFLGSLGVHRFYHKKTGTAVLMLLTIGGFGIWWTIDLILVGLSLFKDKKGQRVTP